MSISILLSRLRVSGSARWAEAGETELGLPLRALDSIVAVKY